MDFYTSRVASFLEREKINFSDFTDALCVDTLQTLVVHVVYSLKGIFGSNAFSSIVSVTADSTHHSLVKAVAFTADDSPMAALPQGMLCRFLLDTGASIHITGRFDLLDNVERCKVRVQSFQGSHGVHVCAAP